MTFFLFFVVVCCQFLKKEGGGEGGGGGREGNLLRLRRARVVATQARFRDARVFFSDDILSGTLHDDARRFRG